MCYMVIYIYNIILWIKKNKDFFSIGNVDITIFSIESIESISGSLLLDNKLA